MLTYTHTYTCHTHILLSVPVHTEDQNPKFGVGTGEMPTFDRNILTSTIKVRYI